VIIEIAGQAVHTPDDVARLLLESTRWGEPATIRVLRGLEHPFTSHPRLDLFVGSLSPHKAQEVGCTICHAGQGGATAFDWASHTPSDLETRSRWRREYGWFENHDWETPMHARRFIESACMQCHREALELEPSDRFPVPPAPKLVAGRETALQYGCFGCHEINGLGGPQRRDEEVPGTPRKVGPSLRHVASKLGKDSLYDWIAQPQRIRPGTRMPQFFGLWDHLQGKGLDTAKHFEPIEILAVATYLLQRSQPLEHLVPPDGIAASSTDEKARRGKLLFETRGCLACHAHRDFPDAKSRHGPNLSKMAAVSASDQGRKWLYGRIRDPHRYNPRTTMPYMFLNPITDTLGNTTGPAEDIAEYLLSQTSSYQPAGAPGLLDETALDQLVLEYLSTTFRAEAQRYLARGIPESMRDRLQGPEVELVGPPQRQKKLLYLGRKTIGIRGCHGCHDVPGFEDATWIGPALSDWGRKNPAMLDFAQVAKYLDSEEHRKADDDDIGPLFRYAVKQHRRIGFIAQKLREPRSFDYEVTDKKTYTELLRMPQFSLSGNQREDVMTFVLGQVEKTPPNRYVYQPTPRRKAIIDGRRVLQKYKCGRCHALRLPRWQLAYGPDDLLPPLSNPTFPFLEKQGLPDTLASSSEADSAGLLHAALLGMPAVGDEDGLPIVLDEDEDPVEDDEHYDAATVIYLFQLWRDAVISGKLYRAGAMSLMVPASAIENKHPALGGDLARMLVPRAIELEKEGNPGIKGSDAWAWLPPPLVGQGAKVQPEWLYDYLLDPEPIRPAALMRMPRYNMTPAEATALVNYFAAVDGVQYPYRFEPRTRREHLLAAEREYQQRLEDLSAESGQEIRGSRFDHAMRLVTDEAFCVKCHLVGDFSPGGSDRMLAPDLTKVYRRLRPDFLRSWIAEPTAILPYTTMPVNLPFDANAPNQGGAPQDLYHGTSVEQLDALVDLLSGYDKYTGARSSVLPLVKPADDKSAGASVEDDASKGDDGQR